MSSEQAATAYAAGPEDWYLVQVKPNGLSLAERSLAAQQIRTFMPRIRATRRRRSALRDVLQPLFPGYLFIAPPGDGSVSWRAVNSTRGVSRTIGFDSRGPAAVPPLLIAGLRRRCDAQGVLGPPEHLQHGDSVEVIAGPFAGYVTSVESLSPDNRVWVLLDLLGRPSRVAMKAEDLRKSG